MLTNDSSTLDVAGIDDSRTARVAGRPHLSLAEYNPTDTMVLEQSHRLLAPKPLPRKRRPFYDATKRLIDIVVAGTVLAVTAPVLLAAVAAVKLTSKGPPIFRQKRVGVDGELFEIIKLRSMYIDADHREQRAFNEAELRGELVDVEEFQLETDPRITPIGAFMRKTSLDEMPQLLNVLKGEMSLVGPRPSCDWEHELFEPRFKRRTDVLPGITGLWQVEGRRTIDMIGMLELDIEYVERRSLLLDLRILVRTIPAVLSGTGAG